MNLWGRLFHHRRRKDELDEEVQAHLRMAALGSQYPALLSRK